jgi:site-specific DNA recombinase
MRLDEIKTVALVLRISDMKKDANGKRVSFEETLKNHKEEMLAYCKAQGYKYKIYEEVLSGGSDLEERIELVKMLNEIETFDAIIVMEISRLARQGDISQTIKKTVIDYRKLIISLNPFQVYDIANKPMDGMIFDINSSMSEYERRIIGMRIKQNKISMAKQGLNGSGAAPLGYIRDPKTKTLDIDPEGAKVVKMAFKMYQDGLGFRLIAEALNDLGYKTKEGNAFQRISIKDMLSKETYKGWLVYNNWEKHGKKRVLIDSIIYEYAHTAIIEPEVFDHVQRLINERAERYGQNRERQQIEPSILKDLLFCSECGRMQRISYEKDRGHLIRKCVDSKPDGTKCKNNGWKADKLEGAILQQVFSYKEELQEKIKLLKSSDFENFTNELEQQKETIESQLNKLNIEMKVIRKLEMKYETEKEESGFTDEEEEKAINEDKAENRKARLKLQNKLDEINDRIEKNPTPEIEINKLLESINIIEQLKKKLTNKEKANMQLKRIIKKIYYTRILPPEIAALGSKNPIRKDYPATLKIEYLE